MPILLELYLHNFNLTLEEQSNYFIEKTKQILFLLTLFIVLNTVLFQHN